MSFKASSTSASFSPSSRPRRSFSRRAFLVYSRRARAAAARILRLSFGRFRPFFSAFSFARRSHSSGSLQYSNSKGSSSSFLRMRRVVRIGRPSLSARKASAERGAPSTRRFASKVSSGSGPLAGLSSGGASVQGSTSPSSPNTKSCPSSQLSSLLRFTLVSHQRKRTRRSFSLPDILNVRVRCPRHPSRRTRRSTPCCDARP